MNRPRAESLPARVGAYEVLGLLGQGGMGSVYRARDPRLDRTVAIKLLLEETADDPARRERFLLEARAIAALSHPNIVAIYSVEEDAGRIFLTMEYVEGRTLADVIPPTGMTIDRLLALAVPLADAVAAAHQKNIIHRDLKPSNVMVGTDGRVRVLDFGLAKLRDHTAPDGSITRTAPAPITGDGVILGTMAYMAPEQAEGLPVDHRTDIFALGVILYEMATGRRPFAGDTSGALIAAILRDMPAPVSDINAGMPTEFARIVRRCLAKDPTRRYQTALDVRNELEDLKRETDSGQSSSGAAIRIERPAAAAKSRRWLLPVGIAAGLAAVALVGYFVWRPPATTALPPPPQFTERQVTSNPPEDPVWYGAISPDGKYVAYGDFTGVHLRLVDTGENRTIPVPPGICFT